MKKPTWVLREVVLILHEQSLAQFGGSAGVRDEWIVGLGIGQATEPFRLRQTDSV